MPTYLKKQESMNRAIEMAANLGKSNDQVRQMFMNRTDDEIFIEIGKLRHPDRNLPAHIYCWEGAELAMDSKYLI